MFSLASQKTKRLNAPSRRMRTMAEEKKKPEPKLYNKLHDRSIDDILGDFKKLFHPDSQENFKKERGAVRKAFRNRIYMHLAQHGVDDKTKTFKRYGYSDMAPKDRRKWVEDFLHTLALDGITAHLGVDVAKGYSQDMGQLQKYIEEHMVTDDLKSYEAIIEKLSQSKNLVDDFDEDEQLRGFMESYIGRINSFGRKNRDLSMHLQKIDYAPDILKYVNKDVSKHGFEYAAHTPVGELLGYVAQSSNPDFKLKKGKFVKELPKPKMV